MTLAEIKAAVDGGQTVQWANAGYRVIKDRLGQYLVIYIPNGSAIGLTDRCGDRINGQKCRGAGGRDNPRRRHPDERGLTPQEVAGSAALKLRRALFKQGVHPFAAVARAASRPSCP